MNEKITTPIERMAALLAEMTERVMEAERTRDAALEDAANWYQHFKNKAEKLEETENALFEMTEERDNIKFELEELRRAIADYIATQKGETENE